MKRVIIFLLLLFCSFAFACSVHNETNRIEQSHVSTPVKVDNEVGYEYDESMSSNGAFMGVLTNTWGTDFNDETGAFIGVSIDDKLALEIADAVLKSVYGAEKLKGSEFIVAEIGGSGYFVVTRHFNIPGGDYNVAISKDDGRILKIWEGE